jgi:hypothetical protein
VATATEAQITSIPIPPANFITVTGPEGPLDWTIPNTGDVDGALRGEFLAKTDGSGICPTGFI